MPPAPENDKYGQKRKSTVCLCWAPKAKAWLGGAVGGHCFLEVKIGIRKPVLRVLALWGNSVPQEVNAHVLWLIYLAPFEVEVATFWQVLRPGILQMLGRFKCQQFWSHFLSL